MHGGDVAETGVRRRQVFPGLHIEPVVDPAARLADDARERVVEGLVAAPERAELPEPAHLPRLTVQPGQRSAHMVHAESDDDHVAAVDDLGTRERPVEPEREVRAGRRRVDVWA